MNKALAELYARHVGGPPARVCPLAADGSSRRMWRFFAADGSTVVGVFGPDSAENRAFLSFTKSFRSIGLPVPELYAADEHNGVYIEQDLGDQTLFDLARSEPFRARDLYRGVIALLPRIQIEGGRTIDYAVAFPCEEFDRSSMMWDLNYFKYHFLKLTGIPFHERRLEQDFESLADALLMHERTHFLYRDFQSRNIMIVGNEPWCIDYQGGRRGALAYDVASLLFDAKANLGPSFRDELLELYLATVSEYPDVDVGALRSGFPLFVLIRILQAMGAYGYRGFHQRKPHFLASVPYAVANVRMLLDAGLPIALPELSRVLEFVAARNWGDAVDDHPGDVPLQIVIRSFSYRTGYPDDNPEHGGGFVFDCRQLDNPGRIDAFRSLNGCDAPVIEYLERDAKVALFFGAVLTLVEGAVSRFLQRGFTRLSVSFGCTGGQHRSVYMAERLARHLTEGFRGVDVVVTHGERERWPSPIASGGVNG